MMKALYGVSLVLACFCLFVNHHHVQATGIDDRIDCLLTEAHISQEECLRRGCIYNSAHKDRVPSCYFDGKIGYKTESHSKNADSLSANLKIKDPQTKEVNCPRISDLNLKISYVTEKIVRIKITPKNSKRYEVPIQKDFNIPSFNGEGGKAMKYSAEIREEDASIVVKRTDNNAKLIDTSIAGLIYCDKFLQFATYLPNDTDYYGFGEHYRQAFKHDLSYETMPMFARDRHVGNPNANGYGHHPFMMGVQKDGKSFGVFLLNSNAMAYTLLPAPGLSLKMTGGIIDVFIFVGDNPEEVVSLYTSVIGRPIMPPFWGLGFQNCRWGYKNTEEVNQTIQRNLKHKIPLEVQYLDIDYMDHQKDFTYSPERFKALPDLIRETKRNYNLKWTLILDPAIEAVSENSNHKYPPFTEGYKNDVFVKWPADIAKNIKFPAGVPTDKNVLYGKVWPNGPAAFPDFFKNSTVTWWKKMIVEMHKVLEFDALWIDMNEPTNFDDVIKEYKCPSTEYLFKVPPMKFGETLNMKTICLDALQGENGEYRHFDVHSLYGLSESKPTLDGLREATKKRGFVVSRSTYPSSGKHVAHWLGDNASIWDHLRQSIVGMMEFSLFGFSFTGADICGFNGDSTPDLCRRWLQLGAYYPFSRSHNAIYHQLQDPGWWAENGHPEVTKSAVEAFRVRYQMLHYYYTAFFFANQQGQTVVRPMHHVFVNDPTSRNISEQFFIGSSMMIAPFLYPNQTTVNAYVPSSESDWYLIENDFVNKISPVSEHFQIGETHSSFPLLFRGGSIIPVVSPKELPETINTVILRKAPISLWILPGYERASTGSLFYDDGESIDTIEHGNYAFYDFKFDKCVFEIFVRHQGLTQDHVEPLLLKEILISLGKDVLTGIRSDNIQVKFDGHEMDIKTTIDDKNNIRINFAKPLNMIKELSQTLKMTLSNKDSSSDNKCFIH